MSLRGNRKIELTDYILVHLTKEDTVLFAKVTSAKL